MASDIQKINKRYPNLLLAQVLVDDLRKIIYSKPHFTVKKNQIFDLTSKILFYGGDLSTRYQYKIDKYFQKQEGDDEVFILDKTIQKNSHVIGGKGDSVRANFQFDYRNQQTNVQQLIANYRKAIDIIKKETTTKGQINNITSFIIFLIDSKGQNRAQQFEIGVLDNLQDIIQSFAYDPENPQRKIHKGDETTYGSDQYKEDEKIYVNRLSIVLQIARTGKSLAKVLKEVKNLEQYFQLLPQKDDNECKQRVLAQIGHEGDFSEITDQQFVDKVKDTSDCYIYDYQEKDDQLDQVLLAELAAYYLEINFYNTVIKHKNTWGKKIDIQYYCLQKKNEKNKKKLIINIKNKHWCVIEDIKNFVEGFNTSYQLLLNINNNEFDIKITPKILSILMKSKLKTKTLDKYVVFDFETIFDINNNNYLTPKSVFFIILGKKQKDHEYAEALNLNKLTSDFVVEKCGFAYGNDCIKYMFNQTIYNRKIDDITTNVYTFVGYNSAKFDNVFLFQQLLQDDQYASSLIVKNSILNLQFKDGHNTFDLCRYTCQSLKQSAKAFKCLNQKIELKEGDNLNFQLMQTYANNGKLDELFGLEKDQQVQFTFELSDLQKNFKTPVIVFQNKLVCCSFDQYKQYKDIIEKTEVFGSEKKEECIEQQIDEELYKKWENLVEEFDKNTKFDISKYNKYMKQLIVYNMFDVLATAEILQKVQKFFEDTYLDIDRKKELPKKFLQINVDEKELRDYKLKDYVFSDMKTICSNNYQLLKLCWENNLYNNKTISSLIFNKDFILTIDEYKDIIESRTGGRCQRYSEKYLSLLKCVLIDVVSLYPYVMLERNYPLGKKVYINDYNEKPKHLIGWFKVCVNQDNLQKFKKILPRRPTKLGETLDWTCQGDINIKLCSSVQIDLLLKHGCKVDIQEGFYFDSIIKGRELFKFLERFEKIKNEQDLLKELKDPQYNQCLRELAKMCMNGISGKLSEDLHTEKVYYIKHAEYQERIKQQNDQIFERLNCQFCIENKCKLHIGQIFKIQKIHESNGRVLINEELSYDDQFKIKNNYRPVHIGSLIYDYAREHMYERVIANYDIKYQDTDSALLEEKEYERLIEQHPEYFTTKRIEQKNNGDIQIVEQKIFGNFDVEKKCDKAFILAPKNYFFVDGVHCYDEKENKAIIIEKITKDRSKGINSKEDCLISEELNQQIENMSQQEIFELYQQKELKLSDDKNKIKLINQQIEGQASYILCSSLQRQFRSTKDQQINACQLKQNFIVKKIQNKQSI